MGLSDAQRDNLFVISTTSAAFSTIGSLLIIILYCRSHHTGMHQFCIFALSASDLISSIFFGLGTLPMDISEDFCTFQATMIQISLSVPFWTGIISLNFLRQIVFAQEDSLMHNTKITYCLLGWLYPVFATIYSLGFDMFGDAGTWCWIKKDYGIERVVFWYGPVWFIFIFQLICIYLIYQTLSSLRKKVLHEGLDSDMDRRIWLLSMQCFGFILAYVICWTPPTINRFYTLFTDDVSYTLMCFHAFFIPFQGFINFLVYTGPLIYRHCTIYRRASCVDGKIVGSLFSLENIDFIATDTEEIEMANSSVDSTQENVDVHEKRFVNNELLGMKFGKHLSVSTANGGGHYV